MKHSKASFHWSLLSFSLITINGLWFVLSIEYLKLDTKISGMISGAILIMLLSSAIISLIKGRRNIKEKTITKKSYSC